MKHQDVCVGLVAMMLLGCAADAAADSIDPVRYSVVQIAPMSASSVELKVPYDIGPDGLVVGTSGATTRGVSSAMVWRDGEVSQMATVPGLRYFSARSVNAGGMIVGSAHNGFNTTRALAWQNGQVTDLGTLGGRWASALAVNDRGHVVGTSATGDAPGGHAFRWIGGRMMDLGTLEGGTLSAAVAISNSGHIVGHGDTTGTSANAFRYHNTFMQQLAMPAGFDQTFAYDVNDLGQTIGVAVSGNSRYSAVLWTKNEVVELGSLSPGTSIARGINNSSQIVGRSVASDRTTHGFLWEGGVMRDLTDLLTEDSAGWTISTAERINDNGEIVGTALYDGQAYSVFLSPRVGMTALSALPPIGVPSPGALALFGCGVLAMSFQRRRP